MILAARGAGKRYRDGWALRGVDLALERGEVVALLGPSGAGKTTLIRALHRLVALDEGRVEGEPRLALVQQKPGLLRRSALENVAFPLRARGASRRTAREAAGAALARVGLAGRAEAQAWTLSGGEAQRVALARALVTRPDALLLDEATNQLDVEGARRVETILREEKARGCAILMATHSVQQARRLADRVALLDAGTLVEEGPVAILDAPRSARLRAFVELA